MGRSKKAELEKQIAEKLVENFEKKRHPVCYLCQWTADDDAEYPHDQECPFYLYLKKLKKL